MHHLEVEVWIYEYNFIFPRRNAPPKVLIHWGRVTHMCVGNLTIIGSDNGLSPSLRQAITWTNAGILLIEPQVTNFSEILNEIHTFSFKKMHSNVSSANWRPFCLGLSVLTWQGQMMHTRVSKTIIVYSVPSHYMNQCWLNVDWTLVNKS